MVSLFAKVKIFQILAKNHGLYIVRCFFLASPKKVLRKVCHSKGNEKRNLMTLISVAQHLRVGSYERLKFFIDCTFEWGDKSGH